MASVQEILAINSRPGDSIKGGSQTYGITIDASPFQRLAEYTYLDNVAKTKAKAEKDKEIALEMGKAMALDVNTTNKEIYEELDRQKKEILDLVKNNKDVFDYNKNPEANKKWQLLYGEFTNNRAKATAFDVLNNKESAEIAKLPIEEQEPARQILENNRKIALSGGASNFFKTGTVDLATITKFTASDFAIPTAGELKYQTFTQGANANKTILVEVGDFNGLYAQSEQAWLGLQMDKFVPQENPNNDATIALRNKNAEIAFNQKSKKLGKYSEETLKKTNSVIAEYNKAYADWKAAGSQGKEPEKPSIIQAVEAVNRNVVAASTEMQKQSARGGKPAVPAFKTVDISDELSGPELVYLEAVSKIKDPIKYTEKGDNHGNAVTMRGQDIASRTADKDRAERKAAREAKNLPPLPPGADEKGNIIYSVDSTTIQYDGKAYPKLKGAKVQKGFIIGADGNILTEVGTPQQPVDIVIPAGKTGAYLQSWYNKYNTMPSGQTGTKVKLDGNNRITARFVNGTIVGVQADNGGFITVDDFQKVSDANSQLKETKYVSETEVGVSQGSTDELP